MRHCKCECAKGCAEGVRGCAERCAEGCAEGVGLFGCVLDWIVTLIQPSYVHYLFIWSDTTPSRKYLISSHPIHRPQDNINWIRRSKTQHEQHFHKHSSYFLHNQRLHPRMHASTDAFTRAYMSAQTTSRCGTTASHRRPVLGCLSPCSREARS